MLDLPLRGTGGRDEKTPLCRSQLQATQTAQKRACEASHHHDPGARAGHCVGDCSDKPLKPLLDVLRATFMR
jgi:hypothetical protein